MRILLNGKKKIYKFNINIQDVVKSMKVDKKYVAVALNGEFISKKDYNKHSLEDGDIVEVVTPHPGG